IGSVLRIRRRTASRGGNRRTGVQADRAVRDEAPVRAAAGAEPEVAPVQLVRLVRLVQVVEPRELDKPVREPRLVAAVTEGPFLKEYRAGHEAALLQASKGCRSSSHRTASLQP